MAANKRSRKADKQKAKPLKTRGSQGVQDKNAEGGISVLSVLDGAAKKIFREALIRRLRHY